MQTNELYLDHSSCGNGNLEKREMALVCEEFIATLPYCKLIICQRFFSLHYIITMTKKCIFQ